MKYLAATLFSLAALPASAHAFLTHADPAVGSSLSQIPSMLTLFYTEGIEAPFCTVTVTAPDGTAVQTGKPRAVPGQPAELAVPLHITAVGTYHVAWHATAVDTHKTQGSFTFTIAP
jgi:methionine-rich copper-binding protein CopC